MNPIEVKEQLTDTVLNVSGLAVSAGGVPLLSGLSFTLCPGEAAAFLGPSGCGKSTLLRAVSGLIPPDAGDVQLRGKPPAEWGWPAFRRAVVMLDQRPVVRDDTVGATLRRPFLFHSAQEPFPEARARELLDRLQVGADRFGQRARSLSVGQQQRVCLIRALLVQPHVLLLDEPTSALDPDAMAGVEEVLHSEMSTRGLALVLVTHDRTQAERLCSRVFKLSESMPDTATAKQP